MMNGVNVVDFNARNDTIYGIIMKNKLYTFDQHLKESLRDPEFKKVWQETEPEYLLAKALIRKREERNLSQRDLAKRLNTSQAVISRIETMSANPSLSLLKRIAKELNTSLQVGFR